MKGIFITGTDTGVGKTLVTAGLLCWLREKGIDTMPMKAAQTGAKQKGRGWVSPDLEFILATAEIFPSKKEINWMLPYCFEPACSPHLAGRMAGRRVEVKKIVDSARRLAVSHECLLIEGAGGIEVPLNESETMLDLIEAMGFPVLLVARSGLGTLNHTLLSLQALRSRKIDVLGVVLNDVEAVRKKDFFIREDNSKAIARFGGVPVLGTLRHLKKLPSNAKTFARIFEKDLPILKETLARSNAKKKKSKNS